MPVKLPFYLYLSLLFCLPLPFAAVYPWGWGLFGGLAVSLLAVELLAKLKLQVKTGSPSLDFPAAFIKGLPLLLVLLAVQVLVVLQYLLSDAGSFTAGGFDAYRSVLEGFSLCAFFALTLLVLDKRKRIEQAIWVVTVSYTHLTLPTNYSV